MKTLLFVILVTYLFIHSITTQSTYSVTKHYSRHLAYTSETDTHTHPRKIHALKGLRFY